MASIPSIAPVLVFSTLPGFRPGYTPREILEFGVFGGAYFFSVKARKGVPSILFKDLPENLWRREQPNSTTNYFNILEPQRRRDSFIPVGIKSLSPAGWFQWYCKFYYGVSNTSENKYRAQQFIEELKISVFYISQYCTQAGKPFDDLSVELAKPWRQQMIQFGYDPTKNPFSTGDIPENALTYNGEVLTYNNEILTF